MNDLAWIEISKSALEYNLNAIRKLIGKEAILAPCVKGNAYGHGFLETSKLLVKYGANWLSVNSVDEAKNLRSANVNCPLLLIGPFLPTSVDFISNKNIYPFISTIEQAQAFKHPTKIFLKLDTGMGRQGFTIKSLESNIQRIIKLRNLEIIGTATHFAMSYQVATNAYTQKQLALFMRFESILRSQGIVTKYKSLSNSSFTLTMPKGISNVVRPGLSVYGIHPSKEVNTTNLKPALKFKTKITMIKEIQKNSHIGYGCTYKTHRETKIGILPVGYYDGYDRRLSNIGKVEVKGQMAPVIGRVCMNMTMIDVTEIQDLKIDEEVNLLGGNVPITNVANSIDTIAYEILCGLRQDIPRYYL